MQIAQNIAKTVEEPLTTFMSEGIANLSSAVSGPFNAACALYVVVFGIMIVLGYVRSPISDYIIMTFKIVFIAALLHSGGEYNTYIKDMFFTHLPEGIGSALGSGSNNNIQSGAAFDAYLEQVIKGGTAIDETSGWGDFGTPLLSLAYMFVGSICAILMFAVVLYAKIMLSLIIAIGPIFIALALFQQTRSFTQSWVGALANFVVLQVLIYALLSLLLKVGDTLMAVNGSAADIITQAIGAIGMFVLSAYIALELPAVSSALAGSGFAIGGKVMNAAVGGAARAAGVAAGMAGRAAGWSAKAGKSAVAGGNSVSRS